MNRKTNTAEVWDKYQTEQRAGYKVKSAFNDPTYYFVKYLVKKNIIGVGNILEIGYGDGLTLQLLSKIFNKVSGADISPKNIELTKKEFEEKNINNADFFVLDLVDPLQIDNKYDVIMLNHVLEHFTKGELDIVVPNILKLLKPGGKLIGAVPYNLPLTYRICPNCGEKFEIDGHQIQYTEAIFRQNILPYGFKEIVIRNHNFKFYSRKDSLIKKVLRRMYYKFIRTPKGQLEFCIEKTI